MTEGDIEQGSRLTERIRRSERENRRLRHDSNERKTVEEVFDKATNFALSQLMARGELSYLNGVVRAGKEARVYWVLRTTGAPWAVKIYLTASAEFKKRMRYVAGDKRFQQLPSSVRQMIRLWVQKEFKNLRLASEARIRCPEPSRSTRTSSSWSSSGRRLLPRHLRGGGGGPCRLQVDDGEGDPTALQEGGPVHADLSEYNIFKQSRKSACSSTWDPPCSRPHPESKELLLAGHHQHGEVLQEERGL